DVLRGAMQVERATVVPEPLPLANDVGRGCLREGRDRRPPLEPALPPRHDSVDLRLLRHDFAHENGVRVAGPPPREIAAVHAEPGQKTFLHTRKRIVRPCSTTSI